MPSLIAAVEIERRILSKCQMRPRLGDVAALGGVDRIGVADALAVLGILAVGDVDDVVVDDRRADHLVARLRPDRVLRDWCRTPTASCRSAPRSRAPSRRPAPCTTCIDAADRRRRSAWTTGRAGCDRPTELSSHTSLPVVAIDRDDRRRLRRRDVDVALVLAVRGVDEEQVLVDDRRRVGEVVRERADLLHHVEHPDDVGVVLAGELLVLVGPSFSPSWKPSSRRQ